MNHFDKTKKILKNIISLIIKKAKAINSGPYAGIFYMVTISVLIAIFTGLISGNSNETLPSNTKEAEAVMATTTSTVAESESTEEETTAKKKKKKKKKKKVEEETTIELIDIDDIEISTENLSEKASNDQKASDSDAPSYIPPSNPESFSPDDYDSLIYGIDVSRWQGTIDWKKVAAAGYKFAFIKVGGRGLSYGSLYYDDKYKENLKGAIDAGLNVGVYFFSQAITTKEALEEASMIVNAIKGYNITYPVVFDWETGWFNDGTEYRANAAKLSNAQMTNIVNTFINAVEGAGYESMVYGNSYDLSLFDIEAVSKTHKIWYARYWSYYRNNNNYYMPGNETPKTGFPYEIWQYKDTGIVPGISEKVDMNVAFVSSTVDVTVKNKEITTYTGSNINLLSGVTAVTSKGKDISSSLTFELYTTAGKKISYEQAISTPGTYTITYIAKDFSSVGYSSETYLYVKNPPAISVYTNQLSSLAHSDSETGSDAYVSEYLCKLIAGNVISVKDCDDKDLAASLKISYPNPFFVVNDDGASLQKRYKRLFNIASDSSSFADAHLVVGSYTITYTVKDSNGLSSTNSLIVNISDIKETEMTFTYEEATASKFNKKLKQLLSNNIIGDTSTIEYTFSEELQNAISTKEFEYDHPYVVTYKTKNSNNYEIFRTCKILINAPEETTSIEDVQLSSEQ